MVATATTTVMTVTTVMIMPIATTIVAVDAVTILNTTTMVMTVTVTILTATTTVNDGDHGDIPDRHHDHHRGDLAATVGPAPFLRARWGTKPGALVLITQPLLGIPAHSIRRIIGEGEPLRHRLILRLRR